MKKIITLLLLLFCFTGLLKAQQKKIPATAAVCDSILCTTWKIEAIEEFSVKGNPDESRQKDAASFMLDKTAIITLNGKTINGTWSQEKNKNYVNVTSADGKEKLRLKIMNVTKDELVFEHQDANLIRTIFYFIPAKK